MDKQIAKCSLCGNPKTPERALISWGSTTSPSGNICNECISLCNDMLDETKRQAPKLQWHERESLESIDATPDEGHVLRISEAQLDANMRSIVDEKNGYLTISSEYMCEGKWRRDSESGVTLRPSEVVHLRRLFCGHDCIEKTPKGFRDLYWCWIINEPEIALGDGTCPGCKCSAVEVEDRHTFIGHVRKPSGSST